MNNLSVSAAATGFPPLASQKPPLIEMLQQVLAAAWRRRYLIVIPMMILQCWARSPGISRRRCMRHG